ncbi:Stage II sporulation protein [Paenibacillus sophorae]|uniref:SpoIID/LytB domain-containing protein n=1 Tax=Paenibacillus sophorae TaxID=1333845 RepID=A0A1H8QA10_9BACL|nr:SpoIID/LytB domain-containing protein [Paenibacillus sophorae]QWU15208.1 SpoIID/LytB domain-containing protein [Paenibacillus sophorae]SEO51069.1 Stage II sporulation protein [Paenibacillus sophorae]
MKKIGNILLTAILLSVFSFNLAFADEIYPHAGDDRPANGTGDTTPAFAGPASSKNNAVSPQSEPGTHLVTVFSEPSTIIVSIYNRDSTGKETTYIGNTTVDFETYVKDVLPNEWYESWGSDGQAALEAGALAVKTFGWFHVISWKKDPNHNANVSNGTNSQMYNKGSNQPNCNTAVNSMANYVIGKVTFGNGTATGTIVETPYRANQTTPGSIMGQYGTYTDAKNGLNAAQIVEKWYSNLGVDKWAKQVPVPN